MLGAKKKREKNSQYLYMQFFLSVILRYFICKWEGVLKMYTLISSLNYPLFYDIHLYCLTYLW